MNISALRWLQSAEFRLEGLGFDLLSGLVHALGPDRASATSGALWRRFAPLNKRHARARAHIEQSLPGLSGAAVDALLDEMWGNLGRTAAEAFHIGALLRDRDRFAIGADTRDAIATARARGAVFVSLHQGNWELAAPILHAEGLPVAGVYQRLRNPVVDAAVCRARAPFYALGLYSKGTETARQLLRIVGDRGTVTIMADLRDLTGVHVPFFGQPAPSTIFPALLARGRDVPLYAGVVMRESGAYFSVKTQEIAVSRTKDREFDIHATTGAVQSAFEGFIRARPGQWMWGHKRWRR